MGTSIKILSVFLAFVLLVSSCKIYQQSQKRKRIISSIFDETSLEYCISTFFSDTAQTAGRYNDPVCFICQQHTYFVYDWGLESSIRPSPYALVSETIMNLKLKTINNKPNLLIITKGCYDMYESKQFKRNRKRYIRIMPFHEEWKFFNGLKHSFSKKQKKNAKKK